MTTARRYTEEEIAAIFKQATQGQETARQHLAQSQGLTLAELQQIGRESGITPEFIAHAAAVVDRSGPPLPPTTYLGFPVSAARTVDLSGSLSDEGWDKLVVDLRETFQASGEVWHEGSLREWRNGNLQAFVEPTESGHRLHLRTLNSTLRSGLVGGMISFAMGILLLLMLAVSGDFMVVMDKTFIVSLFAVLGLGSMGVAAYKLPRWAEERERQMDAVATRAIERARDPRKERTEHAPEPVPARRLDLDALEAPADSVQARSERKIRT